MSKQGQIKVIVLGDSGVGKSSILLRFINDDFNDFSDPTLGAAFLSKIHLYGKKSIRLQVTLWFKLDVGHSRTGKIQIYRPDLLQR